MSIAKNFKENIKNIGLIFLRLLRKITPKRLNRYYHFLWAFLGAVFFRFPSRKLKVIGVTGTSGKSTVVDLITRILEEAGYKVAALSSVKFKIGEIEKKNELRMTMPGRATIQHFLREAANTGCQFAVIEVASEGILQYRHKFVNFEAAVFTNLSPEHIETHGSFENYKNTKGEFFRKVKKTHIINSDDENSKYFLGFPSDKKWVYGINHKFENPDWKFVKATQIKANSNGIEFVVEDTMFHLKLLGNFNIYNSLAAISLALSQGVDLKTCKVALEKAEGIPGRMEKVISSPFSVFVDYAITPNALKQIYETLTVNYKLPTTRLICVLGACGGGRDKWKRPVFGELASKYCNEVIITNEDPYDEDPLEIIKQVASGAKGKAKMILERRQAIREALRTAKEKDVVVITGKGCEPSICITGGKKIPWDDRQVVREEFKSLKL